MKPFLAKAGAFGAGFAVVLAAIAGSIYLWTSRPKPQRPWNTNALRAQFSDIDSWEYLKPDGTPDDRGSLQFTYIVENRSARDYSTDGSAVVAMVRRPDGLAASEGDIQVSYPIFIPSGQRVAVKITIPYGSAIGTIDEKTNLQQRVREKLPKLAGFVLFDRSNRYQIDFPRAW